MSINKSRALKTLRVNSKRFHVFVSHDERMKKSRPVRPLINRHMSLSKAIFFDEGL
jgi:hypothetical protein